MFLKISGLGEADLQFCRVQAAAAMTAIETLDRFRSSGTAVSPAPTKQPASGFKPDSSSQPDLLSLLSNLPAVPNSLPEDGNHSSGVLPYFHAFYCVYSY
jgi:hypothetical protein